jgi:hypothetical protein
MDVDSRTQLPPVQNLVEAKRPRKPKAKRPPKVHVHRLLSSLFKTIISLDAAASSQSVPPITGYPSTLDKGRKPHSNANKKKHPRSRKTSFSTPTTSINESQAEDEKIENWYITYKAHLEPKTRRLMVMTKPTTMRQQNQLKTMRKHHWECKTEIEQQLKHHVPTAFSLKIVRSRIDWERVAPYITLMVQAVGNI